MNTTCGRMILPDGPPPLIFYTWEQGDRVTVTAHVMINDRSAVIVLPNWVDPAADNDPVVTATTGLRDAAASLLDNL